jgi:hypothetical protein
MERTRYSLQILMELEFSQQIIEKCLNSKFNQNPYSGSRVVHAEGRTDRMKLTVAFRDFANAPKKH